MPSWRPVTKFSLTKSENISKPAPVRTRAQRFEAMNSWVQARGGWVISLPGEPEVMVETTESSDIPAQLREGGHDVVEVEGGQRILASSITESVLIEGSTAVRMVRHAGIVPTRRYQFVI
jgi:hypothetical protein